MLDDLQHALLEAGAITVAANDFIRIPNAVSKAVEKLALGERRTQKEGETEDREWFVSAPGKVILFGEHAVVHGVVRAVVISYCVHLLMSFISRRPSLHPWTSSATA